MLLCIGSIPLVPALSLRVYLVIGCCPILPVPATQMNLNAAAPSDISNPSMPTPSTGGTGASTSSQTPSAAHDALALADTLVASFNQLKRDIDEAAPHVLTALHGSGGPDEGVLVATTSAAMVSPMRHPLRFVAEGLERIATDSGGSAATVFRQLWS